MTAIVTPPEIDALPPAPQPTDTPEEFDAKSYASLQAQTTMVTQLNAANDATHQNAVAADERATIADLAAAAASSFAAAASDSADDAQDAAASLAVPLEHYLGVAASDPFARPDASPLQAGDWYINTASGFIRAYTGAAWVQGIAGSSGVTSVNGRQGAVALPVVLAYADRAQLRTAEAWGHALVDGLGWFQWVSGSTEPDDDESCFATTNGRWELRAPHWDVVDAWQLPDDAYRDDQLRAQSAAWPFRALSGSAVCGITSVATVASAVFTGTVSGAVPGDRVIAFPPAALGSTDADSARLSFHACVSAIDTVAVRLCNASASTATTATAIQTAWPVIVLKEI